ncbi:hypothetical protein [Cognatiluteimonas profundi]|uniref:hypothetical protein n=1 Tax=Cognatiluteimonas profundi TaxID=2594501 RepID=UPI00131A9911|nr:hypothetical protein [Lysobacter profundi]
MQHTIVPRVTMLSVILAACTFAPIAARADPPGSPAVTCTGGGLSAPPTFSQVSPGRAEYHFSGVCETRDGRSFGYRATATWTPSETRDGNANASEIYRIDMLSGQSRTFDVVLGGRCERDPWLHGVNCTRVGDNIGDDVRELWPDLAQSPFPASRRGIPDDQRAGLIADYDRANLAVVPSGAFTDRVRAHAVDRLRTTPAQAGAASTPADAVSLNPQPLPPGPPDKQVEPATPSRAGQAGIIIVSGKGATQVVRKVLPPTPVDQPVDQPVAPRP